ncbi:MAG TPA: FG-GAP-like repeat-containing protein [Phycisphaerae bacterium]|nr:FG-GAP-like repeat-containing protein [Phycisphaerae bacterium]
MNRPVVRMVAVTLTGLSLVAVPGTASLPGDSEGDCDVDLADFSAFAACITGPCAPDCDPPLDPACNVMDLDGDGDVDLIDFRAFQSGFSGPFQVYDFSTFPACMIGPCGPNCDPPLDPACDPMDFDGDGDVDLADFGAFQLVFDAAPGTLAIYPFRYTFVDAVESAQLAVTAHYPGGASNDVSTCATYLSDDPLVADVSSDGLVTAIADGQTTVRAQFLGLEALCDVKVTTQPPTEYPESGWIDGIVYDASAGDVPLAGAIITIKDHDVAIPGRVITGPDGRFAFPTPGRGDFFVTIAKNGYTYAQRRAEVTQTLDTAVRPVYLLPEESPLLRQPGPPGQFRALGRTVTGALYTNAANTIQIIWPDGVRGPRDRDPPPQVGATEVNRSLELPDDLPEQTEFTYAYYFDVPGGEHLPEPIAVRFANDLGFAPGVEIPVGRWDNDLLKWVHEAVATVSTDGLWVEYEADDFSACDINLPAIPPPQARSPNLADPSSQDKSESEAQPSGGKPCTGTGGSSFVAARTGELFEDHALPSYRSLGVDRTVRLVYQSRAAKPAAFIAYDLDLDPVTTLVPEAHGFRVSIEGRFYEAWMEGTEDPRRHAFMWDAYNDRGELLPTGSYFYYLRLANEYISTLAGSANGQFGGPPGDDLGVQAPERVVYPSSASGTVTVRDERSSPFGAGWTVGALQRLFVDPGQTRAVLIEGDGTMITFQAGQDLATANSYSNDVSVLLGNGDGTFQSEQRYAVGGVAWDVAVGDFDGDGRQDLVTGYYDWPDSGVSVLLGNGDGTFQSEQRYAVGSGPIGVAVGDFDGDGRRDLATAGTGVSVLLGNGDGTFQSEQRYAAVPGPLYVTAGDFDGDELHDLAAIGYFYDEGSVLLGNGDGTFQGEQRFAATGEKFGVAVGDFDGDGRQDLVTANSSSNHVSVLLGNGDGTFQSEQQYAAGDGPMGVIGVAVGDFDGDGRQDLATANAGSGDVSVLLGNGDGTFQNEQRYAVGDFPWEVAVGDFDGDGRQDLATANGLSDDVSVLLGNGDGTFQGEQRFAVDSDPRGIAVGNFDATNGGFGSPQGEYSRLQRNADGPYTRTMKDGTLHDFDSNGFLTSTVDRNGNATAYEYSGTGGDKRVWRMTDPAGLVTTFAYNGDKLQSVTDPAGRITQFDIDTNDDLVGIINPDLSERHFEYDADHLLTAQVDAGGTRTEYVYDQYGCVTEVIKAVGTPDEQHRYFQASVNQGLINDLPPGVGTYDNPAPPVNPGNIRESYTNGENETEHYYTNRFGFRTTIEDPLGRTTQMERNSFNNITQITFPRGNQISFEYDSEGNLTKSTNRGIVPPAETLIEYDPDWNCPTRIEDPENHVWVLAYDPANGDLLSITDPETYTTTFSYNTNGQVETMTNAEGEVVQFTYYDAPGETGNLHQIIVDPAGLNLATTLEYDAYGNVSRIIDAETNDTEYVYGVMNLLRFVTDAEDHTTEYQYQAALGTVSRWSSAPLAELAKIIDARSIDAATFTYDDLHRLATETNAIGKAWQYTYDDADRLTEANDPKADQSITFIYDDAGQLTTKTLSTASGSENVTYDYNLNGYLTQATDADSDLSFGYDTADRLTSYASVAIAGQPALSLAYAYHDDGVLDTMTDPTGVTTYLHNANHWLTQISDPGARVTGFGYDQAGRRITMANHNGTAVTYTIDDAGRLTDIVHDLTAVPFLSLTYTHDDTGNILTMNDGDGAHTYGYDATYQLTSAVHPNPGVNPNESFSYDPVGNRLTSHLSSSYTYDDANELLDDDDFTYTYDDNGNLATKTAQAGGAVTQYTYDAENRLIRVDLPGESWAEYRYDALGRRIEKNVDGAITRYTYDAEDILFEYDASNNVGARYTHGPGMDEPLIVHRDTTGDGILDSVFYYHADHLGTIRVMTDPGGAAAQMYTYDSFGQVVAQNGAIPNHYLFTSRERDTEGGLYYYRARYYEPQGGRFLQTDPLRTLRGHSRYVYVANNPINFRDPMGLHGPWWGPGPDVPGSWNPILQTTLRELKELRAQLAEVRFAKEALLERVGICMSADQYREAVEWLTSVQIELETKIERLERTLRRNPGYMS